MRTSATSGGCSLPVFLSEAAFVVLTVLFVFPASGGRPADPPTAAAESAAGGAGPEEVQPYGHPEEEPGSGHTAAVQPVHAHPALHQLQPDLHPQICFSGRPGSQHTSSCFCHRHATQLDGQAEEDQGRSPCRAGGGEAGVGKGGQQFPGCTTRLKQQRLCTESTKHLLLLPNCVAVLWSLVQFDSSNQLLSQW